MNEHSISVIIPVYNVGGGYCVVASTVLSIKHGEALR